MTAGRMTCVSCGFGFVERSQYIEKTVAVLLELGRTDAANLSERGSSRRSVRGHLGQCSVGENDVRGHVVLLGNRSTQIAQTREQRFVRAGQGWRLIVRRRTLDAAHPTSAGSRFLRRGRALFDV